MRKVPSYLKGLAERRARAEGTLKSLKQIKNELDQKIAYTEQTMASCDLLISQYDARLNPSLIPAIKPFRPNYGKRGALLAAVRQAIKNAYPETITTTEIGFIVQMQFQLYFETWQQKYNWRRTSLRTSIRALTRNGEVDRCHEVSEEPIWEVGRWRWKSETDLSLDHLRQQAEAQGVSIQPGDAYHE